MENINKISEREDRLKRLEELKKQGINPYPARSMRDCSVFDAFSSFDDFLKQEKIITLAGRLRSKRSHGNLTFCNLDDGSGNIQIAISKKEVGAEEYKNFVKLIDIGDFLEFSGTCFITHKEERSIMAKTWKILSKSIKPLPDKWHGLKNEEAIFRKRYLDILFNREVKEMFLKKEKFWETIRNFMKAKGFCEVETPTLEITASGADARPFKTHHNDFDIDVYLRICVGELWQKRLMSAGFEKTFEIGRAYRNEGTSPEHLQEFTNIEFYWAYADYEKGMELIKELYTKIALDVFHTTKFTIKNYEVDLAKEWILVDYRQEVLAQTGIDVLCASEDEMKNKLSELHIKYDGETKERLIDTLWKYCRKNIAGPAFLINEPKIISPLAKSREDNPELTERFHVILAGSEIGQGFSELNDPLDQRQRFNQQQNLLNAGDDEAMKADYDFVEMLEYGMPPVFGFGFGERLFAYLANKPLRETQIFPLMKNKNID